MDSRNFLLFALELQTDIYYPQIRILMKLVLTFSFCGLSSCLTHQPRNHGGCTMSLKTHDSPTHLAKVATVCLRQRCPCGGKVLRYLLRGTRPQDDHGGEYLCCSVIDQCGACGQIRWRSAVVDWPCFELDDLFRRFANLEIDLCDFDDTVRAILLRVS